jgi:hypothetical protein
VQSRDLTIEIAAQHAGDHGESQADGASGFVIDVYDGLDGSSPVRFSFGGDSVKEARLHGFSTAKPK